MKPVEQLSERTLKAKWRDLNARALSLTEGEKELRTQIEARLWELEKIKHPPIPTPKGFVGDMEDW